MDLSAFADRHLATWERAIPEPVQREYDAGTLSLLDGLYWQAFTQLEDYSRVLESAGLRRDDNRDRQEIIVRHGPSAGRYQHDLVVLDPSYSGSEPASFTVEAGSRELVNAVASYWQRLIDSEGPSEQSGESTGDEPIDVAQLVGYQVQEIAASHQFQVLITSPPPTIPTAVAPAPAWRVVPKVGQGQPASAGVVGTDRGGRIGVTSADHAFLQTASEVEIDGARGVIRSRHPLSDSCFIELLFGLAPAGRDVRGPLSNMSPREGEVVTFDGAASGRQSTRVTGWDRGIPFEIRPWNRLRVFTAAVTNPGDSGAALLAGGDEVIGFAFDRTGYKAEIEYSAWIWAEFVYMAHGLH